jgi:hypothetical protein
MENTMEEDLWEVMKKMGRQHQEGLLIAAEYNKMEETIPVMPLNKKLLLVQVFTGALFI